MKNISRLDRIQRITELQDTKAALILQLRAVLRQLAFHQAQLAKVDRLPTVPPDAPILPDSHLNLPLPSRRVRFEGSWDEGAPRLRPKHRVE